MTVNLIRCSACKQRKDEKLAQATWAWTDLEHLRTAYRQRLCIGCYAIRVLAYDRPVELDSELTCQACGIGIEDEPSITYCTAFIPGIGKMQYAFAMCEEHALVFREMCKENAVLLQEREAMLRGQAPQQDPPSLAAWRALGIEPNDAA